MELDEYISSLIAKSTQDTVAKDVGSHGSELSAFLSGKGRLNLSTLMLLLKKENAKIVVGDEIANIKKRHEEHVEDLTQALGTMGRLLNDAQKRGK